jgi:hypothetical protein
MKGNFWSRRRTGEGEPALASRSGRGYLSTDPERSIRVRVAGRKAFLEVPPEEEGVSGRGIRAALSRAEISRRLSPARDAQALIEIFDDLVKEGELASIRQELVARKDRPTVPFRKAARFSAVLPNCTRSPDEFLRCLGPP